jgi:membrane protease YdiL (CAAX protease family)
MSDEIHPLDSPEATVSVPPPTRPRSVLQKVFVGPHGLRAGWKVLIFFLIFVAVGYLLRPLVKLTGKPDPRLPVAPGAVLLRELRSVMAVLTTTAIMAKWIDRKPWGYFGMPLRNAFRSSFWTGAAVGVGVLWLQLEIMHVCGWFDYGTVQLSSSAIVAYGLMWAIMFLSVGVTEEGTLRGYVQRVTTDGLSMLPGGWSFWASALWFSIIFGGVHISNPGENKFGIAMVFIDGMIMCFSLWRTGNLWFAIGTHAAWDWGQTFLFGTPDSGFNGQHVLMNPSFHGADGPEGSIGTNSG